mmetsp:Transcript_36387/g.91927  ORF Transcript_36387/g.91927 Transcript_36387/m.91927 type:complete len:239 (-) Transcript_36387:379-1095(-)
MAAASASTVRVTASAGRPRCCRPARRSATITTAAAVAGPLVPPRCRLPGGLGVAAAAAALLMAAPQPAEALKIPPVSLESAEARCKISTLDKFADTRAKFSLEASSGAMDEALVDVRGCDFHGQDLSSKVLPSLSHRRPRSARCRPAELTDRAGASVLGCVDGRDQSPRRATGGRGDVARHRAQRQSRRHRPHRRQRLFQRLRRLRPARRAVRKRSAVQRILRAGRLRDVGQPGGRTL